MSTKEWLLNLVFPRKGFSEGDDSYFNFTHLDRLQPHLEEGLFVCGQDNGIEKQANINLYELIKLAKVGGVWDISFDLAKIIQLSLKRNIHKIYGFDEIIGITFVPADKIRLANRGYHIPQLIAKTLSKTLSTTLLDITFKSKHTKSQTNLSRVERLENVVNVFKLNDNYKHTLQKLNEKSGTILIVDDVYTTGSTINEVEKVIKQALVELNLNKVRILKCCLFYQQYKNKAKLNEVKITS